MGSQTKPALYIDPQIMGGTPVAAHTVTGHTRSARRICTRTDQCGRSSSARLTQIEPHRPVDDVVNAETIASPWRRQIDCREIAVG